ncbi:hypothetical protein [Zestomonas carbonaria]|uniref:Flagellin n=1 Tax=Zestomonas carbonaria TaxID=2762745 RepID=A0A7U7ERH7_9GAMM|nr:hypothetical protein [Pseudomonas carbonaria]CAD5109808.1 hypothetical protein PSEWESI4_04122 [Pseudomonas carbonaria]
MKIDTQFPAVTAIEPQERRQTRNDTQVARARRPQPPAGEAAQPARGSGKGASFNIQLNQQLSSMQSADSYLGELASRLGQLKLSLGRELGNLQGVDRKGLTQQIRQVNEWLAQRAERSGNSLDATLKLRLHEPVRARFSLEGLDSIADIQRAGKETLLFSGGRKLAEPLAVVLDEGLSEQQILRRFNASLGQAGIRVELEQGGALKFSARESDWRQLKGQLAVQGEGRLFVQDQATRLKSREDELLDLSGELALDSQRELRRLLDNVLNALDKIAALREQLGHRQEEIREFLARQAGQDEQQWAMEYASSVFDLIRQSGSSYAAVTQAVVAQANINRFTVVSLLS